MSLVDRPKLLYIARRHPRLAADAFVPRWREHAALGMSQPRWRNVALYLHGDALPGLENRPYAGDADGIAVVVYRSEAARLAHVAEASSRHIMKADELETFAAPVAQASLLVRAEVLRPLDREGPRLFVYWAPRTGDFEPAWQAWASSLSPVLRTARIGHVRNRVSANPGVLDCAGVDEFSCADAEPLRALAALTPAMGPAATPSCFLTRVVVLHDRPDPPAGG